MNVTVKIDPRPIVEKIIFSHGGTEKDVEKVLLQLEQAARLTKIDFTNPRQPKITSAKRND